MEKAQAYEFPRPNWNKSVMRHLEVCNILKNLNSYRCIAGLVGKNDERLVLSEDVGLMIIDNFNVILKLRLIFDQEFVPTRVHPHSGNYGLGLVVWG